MKLAMPIGVDDFKKLREAYYFVDKTGFLSDFFPGHAEVTLCTRPRRFGKTLLVSMLRYFFDIEGAEENRKLFDGLAVSRDAALMKEQGTRPVLSFTMHGWKANTWEEMQGTIADGWRKIARQYKYLLESDCVDASDRAVLQRMYDGKATLLDLRTAPELLLGMLEAHYGKKSVFLLDEYDTPIQSAWTNGYYREAIDFFRVFLTTALKSNPSLDFAVLTGVLRVSKESIFSDLNNPDVDSIPDPKFPAAFGFTAAEVATLAKDLGRADKLPELRAWYDGYRIDAQEIYNPWSVLKYFDRRCRARAYWVNTSENTILGEMLRRAGKPAFEAFSKLMQGGTVHTLVYEGFIYDEIYKNRDALYTMLLTTGYLTAQSTQDTGLGMEAELRIPNREIASVFRREVIDRYESPEAMIRIPDLMHAFLAGDLETVREGLSEALLLLTSSFDTAAGKEAFYHGFVLGMTATLVDDCFIRSNREAGYGRYDIAAIPRKPEKPGFVVECKTAESEEALEKTAEKAIAQIAEKAYMKELQDAGAAPVYRYGIAFCGKQVCVKMEA